MLENLSPLRLMQLISSSALQEFERRASNPEPGETPQTILIALVRQEQNRMRSAMQWGAEMGESDDRRDLE